MVGKIESGKEIKGALGYNENKVQEGKAELLLAHLYPKDAEDLTFQEKLNLLQNQAKRNNRTKRNCVHISVNFHPSEKLSVEKLQTITLDYMQGIGFGEQPFLLYQHHDAGHPHLHIVTTCIKRNGKRVEMQNIGEEKSVPACAKLEKKYGLVPATSQHQEQTFILKPADLQKALYGKMETKASISNIVRSVVKHYKFTSLAELNAILGQFNVVADRGKEGSRMYDRGGLIYSLMDEEGNKVGVPIKASAIYSKPTLANLEKKYANNAHDRQKYKARASLVIDDALQNGEDKNGFTEKLRGNGIQVIFRENKDGIMYGITYVDNVTHCVFNGSNLGKSYSAKGIQERLTADNPESRMNRQFVQDTFKETDFKLGFKRVLAVWAAKGLLVDARKDVKGNTRYWMGHIRTKSEYYIPADKSMSGYFRINGLTNQRAQIIQEKIQLQYSDSTQIFLQDGIATALNNLAYIASATIVDYLYNIIDVVFQTESMDNYIPTELLKEAYRKRRRRHP